MAQCLLLFWAWGLGKEHSYTNPAILGPQPPWGPTQEEHGMRVVMFGFQQSHSLSAMFGISM